MPSISKIRLTNVIYENGAKRYNDMIFHFDGHNGAFLLENGGGKTVFIQTVLQAVIPHIDMADRKIKDTLSLDGNPAHIAIEWILNEQPRRYGVTATSLYIENHELKSIKYVYEYDGEDTESIEDIPFVVKTKEGENRSASRGEINDYYERMKNKSHDARTFQTIIEYGKYIEERFKIIPNEWRKIATINSGEGNVDEFFNRCKTTQQLLDELLIPTVEEAIQGEKNQNFASVFEKQREHFKANQRLQEEIKAFEQVKVHIDGYIEAYKSLDHARKNYTAEQYNMYCMYKGLEKNYTSNRRKEEVLYQEKEALEKEENTLKHKELSLEVMEKENRIQGIEEQLNQDYEGHQQTVKKYDGVAARKQNIEITMLEKKKRQIKERQNQLEQELTDVDVHLGTEEIQKKLDQNSQKIQGYYQATVNELEETVSAYKQELERKKQDKEQQKNRKEQKNKQLQIIASRIGKIEGALEVKKQQMESLLNTLLKDIQEESVVSEYMQWKERLRRSHIQQRNEEKELEECVESKKNAEKYREELRKKIGQLKQQQAEVQSTLATWKKEEKALIEEIELKSHALYISDSIYAKEESILQRLAEKKHHLEVTLDEALQEEWRIRGVKRLSQCFPTWIQTLVVANKNAYKDVATKAYIEQQATPLCVITQDELYCHIMHNVLTDNDSIGEILYPTDWQGRTKSEERQSGVEKLEVDVPIDEDYEEKQEQLRKKLMNEWQNISELERQARQFFQHYSYEEYTKTQDAFQKIQDEILKMEEQCQQFYDKENGEETKASYHQKTITNLNIEQEDLKDKIQKADSYIQWAKEKEAFESQWTTLRQDEEEYQKEYEQCSMEYQRQENALNDVEKRIQEVRTKIEVLSHQSLNKETRGCLPIENTEELKTLESERKYLEKALVGVHQDRDLLQERIKEYNEQYQDLEQQLQRKKEESHYPIETIRVYMDEEWVTLTQQMKSLKQEQQQWQQNIQQKERERNHHRTLKEDVKGKIIKKYTYIWSFEQSIEEEREYLQQAWTMWKHKVKEIQQTINHLRQRIEEEKEMLQGMKVKNAKLSFLVFDTEDISIDPEQLQHQHLSMEKLEHAYQTYLEQQHYVEEERRKYLSYCEMHIKDYKLREAVIRGVKKRETYEACLEYQEQMAKMVERNIRIAEEDRRQSDMELQTFLNHLDAYIQQVAVELDRIQRKTRITVEQVTKQIFIFDIPEWDSFEGKERLRQYIETLVDAYDDKEEESLEDSGKRRAYLEQQLSVKNLLNVVLGDQSIKIKCRKVTNDLKINKAPMAWESSNKWSGGEKWSKNMTLFLGLLNYLAEKKQYLSQSQKSQRTVILDNPFGKASSRHVLDPVFFIAEQLGFQIIALTAHAEGKFISDYFPVVYSGRLRQGNAQDKQVMTKEKFINYAYLHEKSPRSIMRMEEKEQLSFLD